MSTAVPGPRPATTLDRLPAGQLAVVVDVGPDHSLELLREGVLAGARVSVRGVAPVGGPVIVEIGRATVAIARTIAATVRVVADDADAPAFGDGGAPPGLPS